MVIVNNVSVYIKKQKLLDVVSCTLTPGHITLFIGKSGAGKTTLLKSLVGLVSTTGGEINIDEKQLNTFTEKQRAEEIGYVFQDFNLFPHLTVLENCIDPLSVHGLPYEQARTTALSFLNEFNMQNLVNKYPSELSGGQLQRVAIVRALCLKPKVLLLDEPTASLDPFNTEILISVLRKLTEQGLTIGLSSQDTHFIRKVFDRVYYLEEGRIVEFCEDKNRVQDFPHIQQFI